MGALEGKVAIVTAAAGAGIGQAVARRFAAEGAAVAVTDAHAHRVHQVGEAMSKEYGRDFLAMEVNVADSEQVNGMAKAVLDRYGRIDVLVNNAGFNRLAPVWEMDDETWNLGLTVNLTGTFYCTRAVLPAMMQQRSGVIVNMASIAGWEGSTQGESHYCAAKAGVMGFTRAVAAEVARFGIRVNAVAPGLIYNPFLERIYPREFFENFARRVPLGRVGEPQDIANLMVFLASEQSSYITGEVYCVSGGIHMKA